MLFLSSELATIVQTVKLNVVAKLLIIPWKIQACYLVSEPEDALRVISSITIP